MSDEGIYIYIIGNFIEIPYYIKSPPGRNALRRSWMMSHWRPAAGGDFCKAEVLYDKNGKAICDVLMLENTDMEG